MSTILQRCSEVVTKIDQLIPDLLGEPQLQQQVRILRDSASQCQSFFAADTYKVAFIGTRGVGKTTAICDLIGITDDQNLPLMITGAGGVTLCEVEFRSGNSTRICIEPVNREEIRAILRDFVQLIQSQPNPNGIASEVVRCVRNMIDFPVRRIQNDDEGFTTHDTARARLDELGSAELFFEETFERIHWDERNLLELSPTDEDEAETWLRENFSRINLGRNSNVPFPAKITIELHRDFLASEGLNLSVLDTRGLDGNIEREDIDRHLGSSHTFCVICTRFADAPEMSCQGLYVHMCRIGLKEAISQRTLLMVIERNNEATEIVGNEGVVNNRNEGRAVRLDEINGTLTHILGAHTPEIPKVIFVNRAYDLFEPIRLFLTQRICDLRLSMIDQVSSLETAVEVIISQREEARTRAAFGAVYRACEAWSTMHRNSTLVIQQLYDPLVRAIDGPETLAAWIRASVNRKGIGPNFDYYYRLQLEARSRTVLAFERAGTELLAVLNNLLSQADLEPAHSFINQLIFILKHRIDQLNEKASKYTKDEFQPPLRGDNDFWSNQQDQWGQGIGYKGRVSARTENWFNTYQETTEKENRIQSKLLDDWKEIVEEVEALSRRPIE